MLKKVNIILLSLTTLLLILTQTSIAKESNHCDVNKFYNKSAVISSKQLEGDFQTTFSVTDKENYISAVVYTYNGKRSGLLLEGLKGVKDINIIDKTWNNNFRFKVIEEYLLHTSKLIDVLFLQSGTKVTVVDAYFETTVSRYAFSSAIYNDNTLLYHIHATSNNPSSLPKASEMSLIMKSIMDSCKY